MVRKQEALRLIDANFNRAKEGLRVCEDLFRFVYENRKLTSAFKKLRHKCSKTLLAFPVPYCELVRFRDSQDDLGKKSAILEKKKISWNDLAVSNMKRSEEAFRVLEEASKIFAPKISRRFQSLRFKLYELEKKVLKEL